MPHRDIRSTYHLATNWKGGNNTYIRESKKKDDPNLIQELFRITSVLSIEVTEGSKEVRIGFKPGFNKKDEKLVKYCFPDPKSATHHNHQVRNFEKKVCTRNPHPGHRPPPKIRRIA